MFYILPFLILFMTEKEGLMTTVVGSFPLMNTPENMEKAFGAECNMGIDYPCYPQLISMNSMFLTPLCWHTTTNLKLVF